VYPKNIPFSIPIDVAQDLNLKDFTETIKLSQKIGEKLINYIDKDFIYFGEELLNLQ
jgi:hypothetical protein